jgi:hypothetical protein
MPTSSAQTDTQSRYQNPSTAVVVGIVAIPVALFTCALLAFICIWTRVHRTRLAAGYQTRPPVPEKDYAQPSRVTRWGKDTRDGRPPTAQQHMARVPLVTTQCASYTTLHTTLGADFASSTTLATPTELEQETERGTRKRQEDEGAVCELPSLATIFSSQEEGRQLSAIDVDLEGAWPKPLQLARLKQATRREPQLWRNSSGGSSFYSRPSSWRSVSDIDELEEIITCRLGAHLELSPRYIV